MKPRRWIVIFGIIILLLGFLGFQGVRILDRNVNLEKILVEHISPVVGGTFNVDKVSFGFFSVYLSGVKVSIPLRSFYLYVQDIKVGLSFWKLVVSKWDFSKSISSIIFVKPQIDFAIYPELPVPADSGGREPPQITLTDLPVERLLVQKGVIRLIDKKGTVLLEGSQLNGQIWEKEKTINFEMQGKFGSIKRNLDFSGALALKDGQRNRISLRLKNARIHKAVRIGKVAVTRGVIDGVFELSYSDVVNLEDLSSSGRITIEKGVAEIDGFDQPVKDFLLKASINENWLKVDSLRSEWNTMKVDGKGAWDISGNEESTVRFRIDGIDIQSLMPGLPLFVVENVFGSGWSTVDIIKRQHSQEYSLVFQIGGYTTWGLPVTQCVGNFRLEKKTAVLDSFKMVSPGYRVDAQGLVNFEKMPAAYSISSEFHADAKMLNPDFSGRIVLRGTVHGLGKKPSLNFNFSSKNLSFLDIPFGNPEISIENRGESLLLSSGRRNSEFFTFSGTVDSILSPQPVVSADLRLGNRPVMAVLGNFPAAINNSIDSSWIRAAVSGRIPDLTMSGQWGIFSDMIKGTVDLHLSKIPDDSLVAIRLSDRELYLSGTKFPLNVCGVFSADSFSVDSLRIMKNIYGSGSIGLSENGNISFIFHGDSLTLGALDAWFLGSKKILRDGYINLAARIFGNRTTPQSRVQFHLRDCNISGIGPFETDFVLSSTGDKFTVQPFVARKNKKIIVSVDTVSNINGLKLSGEFYSLNLQQFLKTALPEDYKVAGEINGSFSSADSGLPVEVFVGSERININGVQLDSIIAHMRLQKEGVTLYELRAKDSYRSRLAAEGFVPWPFLSGNEKETDTLRARIKVAGDLLATMAQHFDSPIGGRGVGDISVVVNLTSEEINFSEAYAAIPSGVLTLKPFVLDDITDFMFKMSLDDSARLHTYLTGNIKRRPITIFSSHDIPQDYEPIMLGPIDCGVLFVKTTEKGVALHVPGLQKIGDRGDVEFAAKAPFPEFALSGPVDRLKITGKWVLRNTEFTFPMLEEEELPWEFDPFPYIDWELDIMMGNRKVIYFYDVGLKRRLIRFVECTIDPVSVIKMRGREKDKTFALYGSMRSYRGEVYYGKVFNRNFEAGIDFEPMPLPRGQGFDNLPIIWGNAEAFADTSRFDRIKLTLLTRNPETGAMAEKGRFHDISFRLSSDFDERPGEREREFYREAGLRFITLEGAGGMVSNFGEQYLHRYFLRRLERGLAKRLGLDVISFETSIASNYFYYLYNNQFRNLPSQWNHLAFANVGVTLGRYFFRDKVFLKWRTELVPYEALLQPEHSIGLEAYPMRYLMVDYNYGFIKGERAMENNHRVNMQLRLPITRLRKIFDF